jgi:hypothetical protein
MEDWSDDFGAGDAAATLARHADVVVALDVVDATDEQSRE